MKGMDVEPWNVIEEPPMGKSKQPLMPMEGTWRLISNNNFEAYLMALGATPLIAAMVIRSDFMVTIYEDLDKQWKILSETCVKAKSIRGYKTRSYKMTANKFQLAQPKPELLEDWDPRLVVTTLTLESEDKNPKLVLDQVAEKDQHYCADSSVVWEANGDILTMTCEVDTHHGPVVAVRKFVRHQVPTKGSNSRKMSAPF